MQSLMNYYLKPQTHIPGAYPASGPASFGLCELLQYFRQGIAGPVDLGILDKPRYLSIGGIVSMPGVIDHTAHLLHRWYMPDLEIHTRIFFRRHSPHPLLGLPLSTIFEMLMVGALQRRVNSSYQIPWYDAEAEIL